MVHGLLSDPQRLLRQYKTHLRRKRGQMRRDSEKEVRDLARRLQKRAHKEGYLLDVAADVSSPSRRRVCGRNSLSLRSSASSCVRPYGGRKLASTPSGSRGRTWLISISFCYRWTV